LLTIVGDRTVLVPSRNCNSFNTTGALWVFDLSDETASVIYRGGNNVDSRFGECSVSKGKVLIGSPSLTYGFDTGSGAVYEFEPPDWDPSYYLVDTSAPTVTLISPANLSTIAPYAQITVDVEDNFGLAHIEIRAEQSGTVESVYDGQAFVGPYATLSSVTQTGLVRYRFVIARSGGWGSSLELSVTPIDYAGNKT
jgi:hypothetical protein